MTMQQDFRALLKAAPAVTDLVGAIDWGESPQPGDGRYIVLHLISDDMGMTMQGPDGLQQARVQVDCYGPSFGTALGIYSAVKAALNGYRGGNFRGIFFLGGSGPSREGSDEAAAIYRARLDFRTNWRA